MLRLNNEQLKLMKSILNTNDLQNGGYMLPAQAKKFLRMAMDTTDLLKAVRTFTMTAPQMEVDKIGVGSRLMRGQQAENEDASQYTQKPVFGKLTLTAKRYYLPWELSEDAIEENIEKGNFEQVVAELMSQQLGLDTEDLAISGDRVDPLPSTTLSANISAGDTSLTVADGSGFPLTGDPGYLTIDSEVIAYETRNGNTFNNLTRGALGTTAAAHTSGTAVGFQRDVLMGNDDGWVKKINQGGHLVDGSVISGGNLSKSHFFELYNALPRKYKQGNKKSQLRWLASDMTISKWTEYLTNRATAAGDAALMGNANALKPLNIPFISAGAFPDNTIVLTNPKNLIVGIWKKVKIRKAATDRIAISTNSRYYQADVKMDFEVEEADGTALVNNFNY